MPTTWLGDDLDYAVIEACLCWQVGYSACAVVGAHPQRAPVVERDLPCGARCASALVACLHGAPPLAVLQVGRQRRLRRGSNPEWPSAGRWCTTSSLSVRRVSVVWIRSALPECARGSRTRAWTVSANPAILDSPQRMDRCFSLLRKVRLFSCRRVQMRPRQESALTTGARIRA